MDMTRKTMAEWTADYEAKAEVRCIRAPRQLSCRVRHWLIVALDIIAVLLCLLMISRHAWGDQRSDIAVIQSVEDAQERHLRYNDQRLDNLTSQLTQMSNTLSEMKGAESAMESKEYGAWGGLAALILANLGLGLKRKRRDDD